MNNQVKSSYDPNIEGKRETIPFKPLVIIPHNIEGYIDYRKNDIEKDRIREKLKDLASAKIKREVDCLRSAGFLVYFSICSNEIFVGIAQESHKTQADIVRTYQKLYSNNSVTKPKKPTKKTKKK